MSKIGDLLKNINKNTAPAMGFRSITEDAHREAMLLILDIASAAGKKARDMTDHVISAAFISGSSLDTADFKQMAENLSDIPLGLRVQGGTDLNLDGYITTGCDFVIFDINVPLTLVNNEKLGRILEIDPSMPPGMLRAINELNPSVDAILIGGGSSPLTFERLLSCQFLADAVSRPLIITIDAGVSEGELRRLHEAGVKALILSGKITKKAVIDLSRMIANLPKITKKKPAEAILPRISMNTQTEPEEEEEEEEDI